MIYYYGTEISPNQIETGEGFLICKNVPIARTGIQTYRAADISLDGDPDRTVDVKRYEEDVFDKAAIASFEGKPVTDGHPPEDVKPENYQTYSKGHAQRVHRDGDFLVADLYINDPVLIDEIRNNVKREVSCGYLCDYVPDGDSFKQTKIRGNHVAVVPRGRAGHSVSIKDECPIKKGGSIMGKFTAELLKVFGTASKDASNEDIEKMANTTAAVLDAAPAGMAQEAEPIADVMVERVPKGDDLGSKLDRVEMMLKEIMKKNDREEKMDRKLTDESDLDAEIAKLAGETAVEKEDAVTIPAEAMEDKACTTDALEILKRVRPVVASIKDPAEKARVTDALLSSVRNNDGMSDILKATKDSAESKKGKTLEQTIEAQQSAYDSLNPHKKSKE